MKPGINPEPMRTDYGCTDWFHYVTEGTMGRDRVHYRFWLIENRATGHQRWHSDIYVICEAGDFIGESMYERSCDSRKTEELDERRHRYRLPTSENS